MALITSAGALGSANRAGADVGIESFASAVTADAAGAPAVQAGSHPYALTTSIVFDHHAVEEFGEKRFVPDGDPKDIEVNLPPGLIVNPTATAAKCTEAMLEHEGDCPNASAVGVVVANTKPFPELLAAVFNMVPPPGVPAEFGFNAAGVGEVVHIGGRVRTGGDYGLSAESNGITQKFSLYGIELTLWGDPSDPSHNGERGRCVSTSEPTRQEIEEGIAVEIEPGRFICPVARTGRPFLTLPSSCAEPLTATMRANSWQEPELTPALRSAPAMPGIVGCGALDFAPRLTVTPAPVPAAADSPSGLNVELEVPQEESVSGLAEANLKDAVVTLPVGMTVSPSAAGGLEACTDTPEPQRPEGEIALHSPEPVLCPDASKVGSVEIATPLLEHPLEGSVYLAQQGSNPFGSLIALYVVAEGSGTLVKLAGDVALDPATGRITTSFESNPQLPFGHLKLKFFGGPRAALATPSGCGTYAANAQLTPYSSPTPVVRSSEFTIDAGCGGGFNPSFAAGTSGSQAGGFSPFSVALSRRDGEQDLAGITVRMPPGLLGKIAGVAQCPEPQARAGSCPEASKIGNVTVAAGAGSDPYWITGGRAYLTGPYGGGPFGLSIVVPTEAGPFNLGPEVVRAAIEIDPLTAALTVVSGPLPTIKDGIPFQIKEVAVNVNREGFTFNPTSCEALHVEGTVTGKPAIGSSEAPIDARVSSPFAVAGCRNLPFKPTFTVSTQGKTSRTGGASLTVKVTEKPGEANIHRVDLQLPTALPARLQTLQKACTEAQFEANPAGCPAASVIGTAKALTPVLSVPLTGPAYLVSHGGAAFPDVVFLLQGQGVTVELVGETDIKKRITFSRFETVPDAPISSFETRLPEGPHSVLATNLPAKARGSLCGRSLVMPTAITGQNGAQVTQSTKIGVSGCPKHKAKRSTNKKSRAARGWKK
ncbi:MAG TPA: hypothetical protein VNY52_01990 [Solirubrobacteraceae bacterium]|nr:hypothetical protein [Solirubrobacteraceae bacterium]